MLWQCKRCVGKFVFMGLFHAHLCIGVDRLVCFGKTSGYGGDAHSTKSSMDTWTSDSWDSVIGEFILMGHAMRTCALATIASCVLARRGATVVMRIRRCISYLLAALEGGSPAFSLPSACSGSTSTRTEYWNANWMTGCVTWTTCSPVGCFGWYIGYVTLKVIHFHYVKNLFPHQSIRNMLYVILKTEALMESGDQWIQCRQYIGQVTPRVAVLPF